MSSGSDRLRVGVIGVGWHGGSHLQNFAANPRAEVVAICDTNETLLAERAAELGDVRAFTDYHELVACEEVDAVVIALPDHLHREPAVAACRAGKHVLCEKPMALCVEDAEAIAAAARESDGCFMLNLSNRWIYPFARGKELIDSGAVGEVRYVFARLANGIHRLDIARWWIGREVLRVRAVHRRGVLAERGFDAPDFYQATLEFDGGAVMSLEGNWILPRSYPNLVDSKFCALCTDGWIDVDRLRSEMVVAGREFEMSTPTAGPALDQMSGFTYAASRHFVECALAGRRPMVTAEDGLALTRVLCAVVRSCEADGEVIALR